MELGKLSSKSKSDIRSSIAVQSYQQCIEELLLNSLDSGSTCIAVRMNVNTGFLQAVDNGKGVEQKCMEKIGFRYNSSKELPLKNPCRDTVYGYRGEALASIIDMSKRLEITSRYSNVTLQKVFDSGKASSVSIADEERPSTGTTIAIYNLFYKAPIRQKFTDPNRTIHDVLSLVQCLACLHHSISLSVRDENTGKVLLATKPCSSYRAAILSVFGPQYAIKLRPICGSCERIQIHGVISKVAYSRRRVKLISVNKRINQSKSLHRAVEKELKNSLICIHGESTRKEKSDRVNSVARSLNYLYVLNLTMDERMYDITFEPSKRTIEFNSEDKVVDVLTKLVRKFIYTHNLHKGVCEETFNSITSSRQEVFHDTHETDEVADPLENIDNSVQLWGSDDIFSNEIVISNTKKSLKEKMVKPKKVICVSDRRCHDNAACEVAPSVRQNPEKSAETDVKAWLQRGMKNVRHWLLNQVPNKIEPLEPPIETKVDRDSNQRRHSVERDPLSQQSMFVNVPNDIPLHDVVSKGFPKEHTPDLDHLIKDSQPCRLFLDRESVVSCREDVSLDFSIEGHQSTFHHLTKSSMSYSTDYIARSPFNCSSSAEKFMTPASRFSMMNALSTYRSPELILPIPVQSPFQRVRDICRQHAYSMPVNSTKYGLSAYLQDGTLSKRSRWFEENKYEDLHGLVTPKRHRDSMRSFKC